MRIPQNIPLETYIQQLIKTNRLVLFYKSDDWEELRRSVMEDFHNECQGCLKRGRITIADCVHHVNHVRRRPDLALSRYYTDKDGMEQNNLIPLCNVCHNMEHPEKFGKKTDKFVNTERW